MNLNFFIIVIFFSLSIKLTILYPKQKYLIFYLLFSFFLFGLYLIGLRDSFSGSDTQGYIIYYDKFIAGDERKFEWLFDFLISVNNSIGISAYGFLFFIALTTFVFFVFGVNESKMTVNARLIFLVFFFSFIPGFDLFINAIRNGLAISICTFAILKYEKNNIIFFALLTTSASLIHTSALVFFIYPVIYKFFSIESRVKYSFLSFFLCWLFSFFNIIDVVLSIAGFEDVYAFKRISAFATDKSEVLSGVMKYYFFSICLVPILLFYLKWIKNYVHVSFVYISLIPYALIFQSPQAHRFSYLPFGIIVYLIAKAYVDGSLIIKLTLSVVMLASLVITWSTGNVANIRSYLF